jgi:hypothetical protein
MMSSLPKVKFKFKIYVHVFIYSKGLKTLALCWVYKKRAFSVSGQFRKALTDLITDLHNPNRKLVQVTLSGEVLAEERFYLLGFVKAEFIGLDKDVWFALLDSKQLDSLNAYLAEFKRKWS